MNVIFWNDCPELVIHRYIGPYKVSHYLKQHGYTSQVIDFVTYFSEEELYNYTTKFITSETLMIGVSLTFIGATQMRRVSTILINVLKRIKQEHPNIKFIAGGYNANVLHSFGVFDAHVTSYGEDITLELLNSYRNKSDPPPSFKKMPLWGQGLITVYQESNNTTYNIETDNFKFTKQDCIVPGETLPIEISRGCMFKCKFCNHRNLGRGKLDYLRSFECVKEELLYNYENFKTTNYFVICDTFNDTEYKMNKWYKMISSLPFKINYFAYLRADLIDRFPDTAYQLKETGLFGAFHGLESLHPAASKVVGKGWSGRHAKEFIPKLYHDMWSGQVPQYLSFIVGLPGDTIESMSSTADWFIDNKLHSMWFFDLGLSTKQIRDQSEFERDAEKYGYRFDENQEWYLPEMNWKQSVKIRDTLNKRLSPHVKTTAWTTMGLLSLGVEKTKLIETKWCDFDKGWVWKQKYNFLETYKSLLTEL
jgi:radical SAM superfamily enzyme YgiQ (UPF0313 family)